VHLQMNSYLALFGMVVLTTSGMLLMKLGVRKIVFKAGTMTLIKSFFNVPTITGILAACVAPLFYLYALSRVELSSAYVFTSLNYVFVFIGSCVLLREKVTGLQIIGIVSITLGLIIFNL
jgi:drug/metabolite transporter (DMT)-like permease